MHRQLAEWLLRFVSLVTLTSTPCSSDSLVRVSSISRALGMDSTCACQQAALYHCCPLLSLVTHLPKPFSMTEAPAEASRCAIPSPMPEVEPVTRATRPASIDACHAVHVAAVVAMFDTGLCVWSVCVQCTARLTNKRSWSLLMVDGRCEWSMSDEFPLCEQTCKLP